MSDSSAWAVIGDTSTTKVPVDKASNSLEAFDNLLLEQLSSFRTAFNNISDEFQAFDSLLLKDLIKLDDTFKSLDTVFKGLGVSLTGLKELVSETAKKNFVTSDEKAHSPQLVAEYTETVRNMMRGVLENVMEKDTSDGKSKQRSVVSLLGKEDDAGLGGFSEGVRTARSDVTDLDRGFVDLVGKGKVFGSSITDLAFGFGQLYATFTALVGVISLLEKEAYPIQRNVLYEQAQAGQDFTSSLVTARGLTVEWMRNFGMVPEEVHRVMSTILGTRMIEVTDNAYSNFLTTTLQELRYGIGLTTSEAATEVSKEIQTWGHGVRQTGDIIGEASGTLKHLAAASDQVNVSYNKMLGWHTSLEDSYRNMFTSGNQVTDMLLPFAQGLDSSKYSLSDLTNTIFNFTKDTPEKTMQWWVMMGDYLPKSIKQSWEQSLAKAEPGNVFQQVGIMMAERARLQPEQQIQLFNSENEMIRQRYMQNRELDAAGIEELNNFRRSLGFSYVNDTQKAIELYQDAHKGGTKVLDEFQKNFEDRGKRLVETQEKIAVSTQELITNLDALVRHMAALLLLPLPGEKVKQEATMPGTGTGWIEQIMGTLFAIGGGALTMGGAVPTGGTSLALTGAAIAGGWYGGRAAGRGIERAVGLRHGQTGELELSEDTIMKLEAGESVIPGAIAGKNRNVLGAMMSGINIEQLLKDQTTMLSGLVDKSGGAGGGRQVAIAVSFDGKIQKTSDEDFVEVVTAKFRTELSGRVKEIIGAEWREDTA